MLSLFTLCNSFVPSGQFFYFKPEFPKRSVYVNLEDTSLIDSLEEFSGNSELKLLTHLNAEGWANSWLLHIARENTPFFPENYYRDYLNMLSVASSYTSKEYFYLGFYPDGLRNNNGPKYIGAFKLLHNKRIFETIMLMESPYYIDESYLINFKYILKNMTDSSHVFFKFDKLKRPEQMRYYLEWVHM